MAWEPGQPLIIDGIRHAEALTVLRQLVTPSELRLVFITVNEPTRTARLRQRESPDGETLQRIEEHTTEAQVGTVLPGIADFLVDGTRPQEELQHIGKYLSSLRKLDHVIASKEGFEAHL